MKTPIVEITLLELQEALTQYCAKHVTSQVERVDVTSNGQILLRIELRPSGLVTSKTFTHRSEA